jgi:hypothetical protein
MDTRLLIKMEIGLAVVFFGLSLPLGYQAYRKFLRQYYTRAALAEVYAALAYFHDNRQEIEALFEAEDRLFERLDQEWEEHVARHGGVPPEKPSPEERQIARPVYWSPKR